MVESKKKELIKAIKDYKSLNCPSFSKMKLNELDQLAQALGVGPYIGQRKDPFSQVNFIKRQKTSKELEKQKERNIQRVIKLKEQQKNLEKDQLKIGYQMAGLEPLENNQPLGPLEKQFLSKKLNKLSKRLTKINDQIKSLSPQEPAPVEEVKPKMSKLMKQTKKLLKKVKRGEA